MEVQDMQTDLDRFIVTLNQWMQNTLSGWGIPDQSVVLVKFIILVLVVALVVYLLQKGIRYILTFVFRKISTVTHLGFFKYTIDNRLPHFLALVIPYSFVRSAIPVVFSDFQGFISPCVKITDIYLVFMVIWTLMAIIRSFTDTLQEKPAFKNKPMTSYLQVIQIIFYIFGAVAMYSIITGKSATAFFAAMGAASAVLMLMFKDTIMGFVGSIQISSNNMVQIGDWITMNKYGADGNVEEINLTTVKVRNFDKTITTIPTYALISDSFQNWRGMQDSGGRRFKRALLVKHDSIRFLSEEELDKFKEVEGLKTYIEKKKIEYAKRNRGVDVSVPINGHRVTNNDLFMNYAINYLKTHPNIAPNMTLLVRQLSPTSQGIPVELYSFTNTTVWAEYETVVAEVVNHLVSAIKYFDLIIYEESSGSDLFNVVLKNVDKE